MPVTELGGRLGRLPETVVTSFWFRPALTAVLVGTLTVGGLAIGSLVDRYGLVPELEPAGLVRLLDLIAGSSLTVLTVTLSAVAVVLTMASGQGSPRVVPSVMADPTVQNAFAGFVGAFVFGVTGLVAVELGRVSGSAVVVLLLGALAAILVVLRYLVQLVHHVSSLMNLERLIDRVHEQAGAAIEEWQRLAAAPRVEPGHREIDGAFEWVMAERAGFVTTIVEPLLVEAVERHAVAIELLVAAGDPVSRLRPLARVSGATSGREAAARAVHKAVTVAPERTPTGDLLLSLALLSEIGARALSPGINDPITAISCAERLGDLLAAVGGRDPSSWPGTVLAEGRLRLRRPDFAEMLETGFAQILRFGASNLIVVRRLIVILRRLREVAKSNHHAAIDAVVDETTLHAIAALPLERERQEIRALRAELGRETA